MGHIKDLANMSDEETETLALIKAQSKRQFTDSLKRPAATLAYLMNAQMIGQPVLTEQRAHDYINSVTPADVRAFAQQVLEEFVNVNAEFSPLQVSGLTHRSRKTQVTASTLFPVPRHHSAARARPCA